MEWWMFGLVGACICLGTTLIIGFSKKIGKHIPLRIQGILYSVGFILLVVGLVIGLVNQA